MVSLMLFLCLFAGGMFCPSSASAQKTVRQSEKMRPAWLSDKTPRPTNATFHYRTVEAQGNTLDEARRQCLVVLSEDVERTWEVSGGGTQDIREVQTNGEIDSRSVFTYHYNVAGEEVSITTTCYDEYWECVRYPDGALRYHCYMLFGVADTAQPEFDRLRFTRKYGARGLWRSLIIPGWGQFHKGSYLKGGCILGSEILCAAGIILCESQRVDYKNKVKEQPRFAKTYNTKANNWAIGRNLCIGMAGAIYIYNLIDAAISSGARRIKIKQSGKADFTYKPCILLDASNQINLGLSLSYNF